MNAALRFLLLGVFLFLTGPARADSPLPPASASSGDLLTQSLGVLQAQYIDFPSLGYKDGDRLDDLIARSQGRISLVTPKPDKTPGPIVTASLPGGVAYWRLGSFTPKTGWPDLVSQLQGGGGGVILDLRSNDSPGDFAGAARVLNFFAPTDFALRKFFSGDTAGFTGDVLNAGHPFPGHSPLIVLINGKTSGAAEGLAACLKADGALVMGNSTGAGTPFFAEQTLGTGQVLRYALAPLRLPEGGNLGDRPVVPDISLAGSDPQEKIALALIGQGRVLEVITEAAERPRMSEAALVRGDNPVDDAGLASRLGRPSAAPTAVQDIVLISTLDSLKAIDLSQRSTPAIER